MTHIDKDELVAFLKRQKTNAYEEGMDAIERRDMNIFYQNKAIVNFLEWLIYIKIEQGRFDVIESPSIS